jgi:hypothetical protein
MIIQNTFQFRCIRGTHPGDDFVVLALANKGLFGKRSSTKLQPPKGWRMEMENTVRLLCMALCRICNGQPQLWMLENILSIAPRKSANAFIG